MSAFSFDFTFTYYPISALINVVTSLILGTFIYFKNRKEPINIGFGLFCWSVAAWSLGYFLWQVSATPSSALFWSRALMVGAIFTPLTFLQFVFGLLDISKEKKRFLVLSYLFLSLFVLLDFTNLFVKNVEPALSFSFWPKPGPLYHPFLAIWFSYLLYAAYLLIKHYKHTIDIKRAQIRYVLAAMVIAFASGSTNYFLWYNIPIPPFANILVSVYVIIITYAVLKHHLFNLKVIATEFLVGIIAALLYVNILTSKTTFEYAWKGGALLGFLVAGYLLIKSVLNEIKIREQLQAALLKLQELDKAKSEFLSIASHQLRAPLTAIKGYLSMLMEGTYGPVGKEQKQPMTNVYDSNERMIKLVNDLLNISRIESGRVEMNWEEGSIEEILEGVVQELQVKAHEKRLDLIFEKPQNPLPLFRFDKEKIRNVVLNLVDNAIHYTEKGSVKVNATQTQNTLRIAVTDTGLGMSKEEIQSLFQSFTRGETGNRAWAEGSGLGLYIAKQFVALHKGTISAQSQGKGQGSTFVVELPLT